MRVVQLLGPSAGGIGTHVAQLAAGLRRSGDQVVVVAPEATFDAFPALDRGDGCAWWPLERSAGAMVRATRELPHVRALVSGADVLHAHGHRAGLVGLGLVAGLRAAPRFVVSLHNAVLAGGGPGHDVAQRCVARRADLVTGASSDLVAGARRHGARPVRLAPVPSPRVPGLLATPVLDAAGRRVEAARLLRAAHLPDDGRPLVVTVSRTAQQKDLPVLVEAAAALRGACVWVVVGTGDPRLERQLREQVVRLGAPVHFIGHQGRVDDWLRAAEVFVLTSRWEARALVVQEAMAAGTPVVATEVGGLPDLLAGPGSLVPVGDAAAVAVQVRQLLRDPALRRDRAALVRSAARDLAGEDDTVAMWRGWYAEPSSMT